MEKLVSIIISVYNKELYLRQCIESLIDLKMDKDQIEAIFVDDCSTDQSVDIIQEYAKDHAFIHLIQLPHNTGSPSEPRNVGIEKASGKYITLLDADDWLDIDGFPQLMEKVNKDDADLGLGQCFKHTAKSVSYHGKFTSYKEASHLKPQEIKKLFRAVGPPGKIFKRQLVIDNQIKFEHMKYGEDKLFFVELYSKVNDITMSVAPMYHVNRYDENESLVKQTSMLDKAQLNLEITRRICNMEMDSSLKEMIMSRIVEIDFISRFLRTKTFIKSQDKQAFYDIFDELEQLLTDYNIDVPSLVTNPVFKAMYTLYHQEDKTDFINFTKDVVYNKWRYIIQDNVIYRDFVRHYDAINPIPVDCYPIYEGTHLINGNKYEVIRVMKPEDVKIRAVNMIEINNMANSCELEFEYANGRIYISHDHFKGLDKVNINLSVEYGEADHSLVYASFPSFNDVYTMKRQSFKLELMHPEAEKNLETGVEDKYFVNISGPMMTLKTINIYQDLAFKEKVASLEAGSRITPKEIQNSSNGTPRLVLEDGNFVTANKDFITLIKTKDSEKYITETPNEVKIIKVCKLYDSRQFKDNVVEPLKVGETLQIKNIIYTKSSTPRLVTEDGYFLTANKDFVEILR
ncbi:DUF5776 domain-containing protein [Staphylococcus petrasii]|uniref:DUF5776 domain-containing protein n=1 Tax=Staphylococcus petrasii TaxID=1276936 RepID=UPI001F5785D0|nr:DUF5776 domain-containing protein [Staphylococcus petrasii]MCI2773969.1 DUF5776 domain-containing protein [Staphylococcus petrasii]